MKTSLIIGVLILVSISITACSSAKTRAEPVQDPSPMVENATAPADLGAPSSGRGL